MSGGTLGGSNQGGTHPAYPLPNQLEESAQLSGRVLHPQRSPPGHVRPGGTGGRMKESRRGRQEGRSSTGGAGDEWRMFVLPTQAQEACWAPRWGPLPSGTRGAGHTWDPAVLMSLIPTPHSHQNVSFSVDPKHRPHPLPKHHPCLGPTLHRQGLFHFFLLFFTIVVLF